MSCFYCNSTGHLCGRCGEAENACQCGGIEDCDIVDCPECQGTGDEPKDEDEDE